MSQLDDINAGFKSRSKRTSPTMTSRDSNLDELRIQHVMQSKQGPVNFVKLREKVDATLEAAKPVMTAAIRLKKVVSGSEMAVVGAMKLQMESLIASLTSLQRKLA
jgi:hypothetical protein